MNKHCEKRINELEIKLSTIEKVVEDMSDKIDILYYLVDVKDHEILFANNPFYSLEISSIQSLGYKLKKF
jgi:hypothetical protein